MYFIIKQNVTNNIDRGSDQKYECTDGCTNLEILDVAETREDARLRMCVIAKKKNIDGVSFVTISPINKDKFNEYNIVKTMVDKGVLFWSNIVPEFKDKLVAEYYVSELDNRILNLINKKQYIFYSKDEIIELFGRDEEKIVKLNIDADVKVVKNSDQKCNIISSKDVKNAYEGSDKNGDKGSDKNNDAKTISTSITYETACKITKSISRLSPSDRKQIKEWCEEDERKDRGDILNLLGCLSDVEGKIEDKINYYQLAAEKGNVFAMNYLGNHYAKFNKSKAIDWYTKAAELGFTPAMKELYELYANMIGPKNNSKIIAHWKSRYEAAVSTLSVLPVPQLC